MPRSSGTGPSGCWPSPGRITRRRRRRCRAWRRIWVWRRSRCAAGRPRLIRQARRVPRSPASSGGCVGRMRGCVGRTRSCRARRLFSPHGSTRHDVDGRVHRHSSPPVRGRADLHGPAGCAGWRVSHRQSILAGQSPCRQQDACSSRDAGP